MKQENLERFRRFLEELRITEEFSKHYDADRIGDVSLDDYLMGVDEDRVFIDGFREDYDDWGFWQDTDIAWHNELKKSVPIEPVQTDSVVTVPDYKFCPACWQLKPANDFQLRKAERDGLSAYCRNCMHKLQKKQRDFEKSTFGCYELLAYNGRIYLNLELSAVIRKGEFNHCGLRHHNGNLFLVFCETKKKKNLKYYSLSGGVSILDDDLFKDVLDTMGVKGSVAYHLHVTTNMSKKPGAATIQVLEALTPEEYQRSPISYETKEAVASQSASQQAKGQLSEYSLTEGYKLCASCLRPKALKDFGKHDQTVDGLRTNCFNCSNGVGSHYVLRDNVIIYFAGKLFFGPELSRRISAQYKSCYLIHDYDPFILGLSKLNVTPYRGKRQLTVSKTSGTVSLHSCSLLDSLVRMHELDPLHAYWTLGTYCDTESGEPYIAIKDFKPWNFLNDEGLKEVYQAMDVTEKPPIDFEEESPAPTVDDKQGKELTFEEKVKLLDDFLDKYGFTFNELVRLFFSVLKSQFEKLDSGVETAFLEEYMAKSLKSLGWKLQRPVKVIKYEEF